jgi:glycosyltransferase involved in cell wall biosynthesis
LVDVTQFVSWPASSGIQRVLQHLTEEWGGDDVEALYGFIRDGRFVTGPLAALANQIAAVFRTSSSAEDVERALTEASERSFSVDDVEQTVDGYLLPEPTLRTESLDVATRLIDSGATPAFFVYYDPLPLTHPECFAPRSDGRLVVTRYHSTLARAANIAFISRAVKEEFETRMARREVMNGIVARPGADGLGRAVSATPERPTFVAIGTVEPRKRHRLMLEAFDRLWAEGRDFRLVILGRPGWEEPDLIERLRQLSTTPRLTWIELVDDDIVAAELSRASALIFPSEYEGYGIPPLEALARGCPVIVTEDIPALDGLSGEGQIRLPSPTVEALVAAIDTLADPTSNAVYRRAIADLELPTWQRFTADVEQWNAAAVTTGVPEK